MTVYHDGDEKIRKTDFKDITSIDRYEKRDGGAGFQSIRQNNLGKDRLT